MTWARDFEYCQSCGTTEEKHRAKGLCSSCYNWSSEVRQKSHITRISRHLPKPILIDELETAYQSGMSLNDLARLYNCTRQYIHKLIKKYGIATRKLADARNLALEKGKVKFTLRRGTEYECTITHQKRHANEEFFRSWTPAMAWVLGVIYTDGCLYAEPRIGRHKYTKPGWKKSELLPTELLWGLSIAQKEPELLEKVRAHMGSNELLSFHKKRGIAGALYTLRIRNAAICADLQRLGVTANKSLTITLPEIPSPFIRHFIRGCWDGDGSVYLEAKDPLRPRASFVSGSKHFIVGLLKHLVDLGLPERTIHIRNPAKRGEHRSYSFRFSGRDCVFLSHVLYDDVDESMCLSRKRDRFKASADYCEREGIETRIATRRRPTVQSLKRRSQQIQAAVAALKEEQQGYTSNKLPV